MINHSFPRRLLQPIHADGLLQNLRAAADAEHDALALHGNPGARIDSVANPSDAEPGSLIFCRATDPERLRVLLENTRASVILAPAESLPAKDDALTRELGPERALLVSADPLAHFIRAVASFELAAPSSGAAKPAQVNTSAADPSPSPNLESNSNSTPSSNRNRHAEVSDEPSIAPSARIAPGVMIGEHTVIGSNTVIGAGTIIGRFCRIGANVSIGHHCTLEDGTWVGDGAFIQHQVVIGSIGLGYHLTAMGERLLFPHLGIAIVGEDAVIGCGSVIVRGQLDDTQLGRAVRLGNLVNIGHNVKVGDDCALSSGVVVAGGATIGPRCNIGIGAMVNAKIQLGSDCQIGMASVVTKSLSDNSSVFGNPARALPTMGRF